jgi:hypothetical protein
MSHQIITLGYLVPITLTASDNLDHPIEEGVISEPKT